MTNIKTLFRTGNTGFIGKLLFTMMFYIACNLGNGFAQTLVFWVAYVPISIAAVAALLGTMAVLRGFFRVNHPDKVKQWRRKNIDMSFSIGAGSPFFWFVYMVKELVLLAIKRPTPHPKGN